MNTAFEQIDITNDKVQRIVRAALKVFTQNDFEKASTNWVVKEAGISRGLLYHYFTDKQELFDFLLYFSVKSVLVDLQNQLDWEGTDFLQRIRRTLELRIDFMMDYPYLFSFYEKYYHLFSKEAIDELMQQTEPNLRDKLFSYNIDFSQIQPGVDSEILIEVIKHTISGMFKKEFEKARVQDLPLNKKNIMDKTDVYLEFFRQNFF